VQQILACFSVLTPICWNIFIAAIWLKSAALLKL
jgi:hypothetical protein